MGSAKPKLALCLLAICHLLGYGSTEIDPDCGELFGSRNLLSADEFISVLKSEYRDVLGPDQSLSFWLSMAQGGIPLGGNIERSYRVTLGSGQTAVYKEYRFTVYPDKDRAELVNRAAAIVDQVRRRYENGRGPKLLGIGFEKTSVAWGNRTRRRVYRLKVVTEDMENHPPYGKRVAAGNIAWVGGGLKKFVDDLAVSQRIRLAEQIKERLKAHTDPNLGNVMFRVVKLDRNKRSEWPKSDQFVEFYKNGERHLIQIFSVDASGGSLNPNRHTYFGGYYDRGVKHFLTDLDEEFGIKKWNSERGLLQVKQLERLHRGSDIIVDNKPVVVVGYTKYAGTTGIVNTYFWRGQPNVLIANKEGEIKSVNVNKLLGVPQLLPAQAEKISEPLRAAIGKQVTVTTTDGKKYAGLLDRTFKKETSYKDATAERALRVALLKTYWHQSPVTHIQMKVAGEWVPIRIQEISNVEISEP